jgi:hypothetical protein
MRNFSNREPVAPISYDIVMEMWFPTAEDFLRAARPMESKIILVDSSYCNCNVLHRLHKDPRIVEAGPTGKTPTDNISSLADGYLSSRQMLALMRGADVRR